MHVQLRIINNMVIPFYKVDSCESCKSCTHPDSGFDLFCPEQIIIPGGARGVRIDLGIQCAAYDKFSHPSPYFLFPRSSISKTPLRLANSVGIIDSGYRGNLMAAVDNMDSNDYLVEKGSRLFQMCAPNLEPINVVIVDTLDATSRGGGGFGSTGK